MRGRGGHHHTERGTLRDLMLTLLLALHLTALTPMASAAQPAAGLHLLAQADAPIAPPVNVNPWLMGDVSALRQRLHQLDADLKQLRLSFSPIPLVIGTLSLSFGGAACLVGVEMATLIFGTGAFTLGIVVLCAGLALVGLGAIALISESHALEQRRQQRVQLAEERRVVLEALQLRGGQTRAASDLAPQVTLARF